MKSNYWIHQRYKLHYYSTGNPENPCLLCLHGFLGSGLDWQLIADKFSNSYYCIFPDIPGHGLTEARCTSDDFMMENIAKTLDQFLHSKKISRSSLLGYSMGGRLSLYLVIKYPHIWKNLILESSSPGLESEEHREERIDQDEKLAQRIKSGNFDHFLREWYQQPLFKSLRDNSDFENLISRRLKNNPETLALSLKMMGTGKQPSLWKYLSQIDIPVLLLVGEFDRKFSNIMGQMVKTMQHVELKVVKSSGHNIHFEQPLVYSDYIYYFLRQCGREHNE